MKKKIILRETDEYMTSRELENLILGNSKKDIKNKLEFCMGCMSRPTPCFSPCNRYRPQDDEKKDYK